MNIEAELLSHIARMENALSTVESMLTASKAESVALRARVEELEGQDGSPTS